MAGLTAGALVKDWTCDNVGKWLSSINMGYMAVKFETLRIDGQILMTMDDSYIDTYLRLNPAERAAFTGALHVLRSSTQLYNTIPGRNQPAPPPARLNTYSAPERPRFDSESSRKIVKVQHSSSTDPKPELKLAPAMELLRNCRHSGWIRKQGGSHKGWRQRYMVLRLGHLYYYEKETSFKAKGYFSLKGYRIESNTEVFKGKPWCFKLIPDNPGERTYVVSTAAEHEMKKWMGELQDEIDSFEDHVYDPVAIEEEDVDIDDEDDDGNYEKMDNPLDIYDDVEDTGYVKITQIQGNSNSGGSSSQTFPRSSTLDPPTSPKRTATLQPMLRVGGVPPMTSPMGSPFVPPRSRESLSSTVTQTTDNSNPYVPPRSRESLAGVTATQDNHTSPVLPPDTLQEENPYYIKLIDSNDPSSSTPPTTHVPPQIHPSSTGSDPHRPPRRSTEVFPNPPDINQQGGVSGYGDDGVDGEVEEENPYYIKLDDLDDVMPKHCQFGSISRDEAVRRLTIDNRGSKKYSRPGTYLIRDSSHQDVLHVLTVWTGNECKHYKLFSKDSPEEGKGYCLTQGKLFPSIPLLLSYYKQEELPRSPNVTLTDPYHPHDH